MFNLFPPDLIGTVLMLPNVLAQYGVAHATYYS